MMIPGIKIEKCGQSAAKKFLEIYHYDGFGRSAKSIYSASTDRVIGICKFSTQGRQGTASSLGIDKSELLELDRFCIHEDAHIQNLGSYLMSRYIKAIKVEFPELKALVSFADPAHGHDGTLYKASNWKFIGKTSPSYHYISPNDGKIIKKKSFYNHIKKHGLNEGMSESRIAIIMGLVKVLTPPKLKFAYFF